MKTIKHIIISVFILSMISGSFNFSLGQENALFFETYRSGEIISLLGSDDPVFSMIDRTEVDPTGSKLGYCAASNQEDLMALLKDPAAASVLPDDILFTWGKENPDGKSALYALKKPGKESGPGTGDIESVTLQENSRTNSWDLLITLNREGGNKWARMTRENVGRDIAIVVDRKVISAPRVQDEIKFGKCRISGDMDKDEAAAIKKQLEH